MAKAKAIQQKPKNKVWEAIKYFLRTLISNNACIDGREHKWYWPILVAFLAACIATIPTMVGRFTTKASTFFTSGYLYDYENALTSFNSAFKDVDATINEGILTVDETEWNAICVNPKGEAKSYWGYYYKVPVEITTEPESSSSAESSASSSSEASIEASSAASAAGMITTSDVWYCGLAVYYSGATNPYQFATTQLANNLYDPNYQLGHTNVTAYSTNMIVIGENAIFLAKGTNGPSTPKGSIQVKFDHPDFQGKTLQEILTPTEEQTVIQPWEALLDKGYSSTRVTLAWQYTGITFAINVGIIFLMGLLVLIMTRGKNNPFRIYTFWQCQKIAYWGSFSPALLSMISFIPMFAGMTMFIFPMFYILRITWMSMRSLRPQQ